MNPQEIYNECSLSESCGGCYYAGEKSLHPGASYAAQFRAKEDRVKGLLSGAVGAWQQESLEGIYEGTYASPMLFSYRNKMEYSFGDDRKDGPLTLGLHKKKSFYDVIDTDCCRLVHEDCNRIVSAAALYFRQLGLTYQDKRTHLGYLRHLLIRRAVHTGDILVDLVTGSQPLIPVEVHAAINDLSLYTGDSVEPVEQPAGRRGRRGPGFLIRPGRVCAGEGVRTLDEREVLGGLTRRLLLLDRAGALEGQIRGILHTVNDSLSDAVRNDHTEILYGEDFITEELLGLKFRISPFSFFQTNTRGAELLYSKVREMIQDELKGDRTVYDLYSGTGTIAQMMAPCVKQVVGVEIVEEAVAAAKANAAQNGLSNCSFLCDDVLHALDILPAPDLIILDPPRDGVHPKALPKLISYGVPHMVYVSCKPESLARDLGLLLHAGYRVKRAAAVDQFPWTDNIETVCLLSRT